MGNEFSQMLSSNTDTQVEKINNLLGLKNHKWFCCQARESSFWDELIFCVNTHITVECVAYRMWGGKKFPYFSFLFYVTKFNVKAHL